MTSSYTLMAALFPTRVASIFSYLEAAFGLGMIVGPTLGGAIYELGGFTFPFAVLGAFLMVGCFVIHFLILFLNCSRPSSITLPSLATSLIPTPNFSVNNSKASANSCSVPSSNAQQHKLSLEAVIKYPNNDHEIDLYLDMDTNEDENKRVKPSMINFINDRYIIFDSLAIITSLNFIGFNAATLEPHLRQF